MVTAVIAAAVLAAVWGWWHDRRQRPGPAAVTLALRLASVAALGAAVYGVDAGALLRPRARPAVILLVDGSASMALRDQRGEDRRQRAERVASRIAADRNFDCSRLEFGGDHTDLVRALEDGARGSPDAMVLLTDGNHNRGGSPVEAAAAAGVRVDAVGFGPGEAAGPVIGDVDAPDRAEIGEPFTIRAAARGVSGRVNWTLSESGRVLARAAAAAGERPAELTVRAHTAGAHRYQLEVAQDGRPGDRRALTVVAGRSRISVAWLSLGPDWNLRFASQALAADPAVSLAAYARIGGRWVVAAGLAPVSLDTLGPCDAAVISGGGAEPLPSDLERFIGQRVLATGGGVLLIGQAGPSKIPWPLRPTGERRGQAGMVITEPGWWLSGLIAERDTALAHRIRTGPPMAVAGRLAAADSTVVVLASVRTQAAGTFPLWAWRRSGAGRVMQFASAGLWSWKLGLTGVHRDSVFYDRLITAAVRWLAGRDNGAFQAGPERAVYAPGERVSFRGRWRDWEERAGSDARWNVTVNNGTMRRTAVLADWGGGDYAAEIGPLEPGAYDYRAELSVGGRALDERRGRFFVEPGRDELSDRLQNRELLREVAAATGGRHHDEDSVPAGGSWPRSVRTGNGARAGSGPLPWALAAIVLLAGEWTIRRRRGLR